MNNSLKKHSTWTGAAPRRLLRFAGDPPTVEEAVRIITSRLLEDVPCPPTDLGTIFSRVNVTGCDADDIAGSGELRRDGKAFKIIYSPTLSLARRRFTIAHELGHAIFEMTGPRCPRSGNDVERLCDMMATELLMPRGKFLEAVGSDVTVQKILSVASLFQTSLATTAIRFAELLHVSTFEVDDTRVSWGYGVKKRKDTCSDIGNAVQEAMSGRAGEDIVAFDSHIWRGQWLLQWVPIGTSRRALFLAKPIRCAR
jgi:hypothetical protein